MAASVVSFPELWAFVQAQLDADERMCAAAIVRGDRSVQWTVDGQVRDVSTPSAAWGDLRVRHWMLHDHTLSPVGRCWGCGERWPCPLVRLLLQRWSDRPGFRRSWVALPTD